MTERVNDEHDERLGRDEFFNKILKPIVRNSIVGTALMKIDRKDFIPSEYQHLAYMNHVIPLGESSSMSEPAVIAEMLDLLELSGKERVLEIGTASGYNAALLSLCAAKVDTVESDEVLAQTAQDRLQSLGYTTVRVHIGDGVQEVFREASFNRIILTAGAHEFPQSLFDQLEEGGIIVGPIGGTEKSLRLAVGVKEGDVLRIQYGDPVEFHLIETSRHGGWSDEAQKQQRTYTVVESDIPLESREVPRIYIDNRATLEPSQECLDILIEYGLTQAEFIDYYAARGKPKLAQGLLTLHPEPFKQVLSMVMQSIKQRSHDL